MPDNSTALQALVGNAPSMMESAQKALTLRHQMIQTQSEAAQLRAREALGPILQGAIDKDGKLDYNKAFVGMAAHPDTAWMAPEFLDKAIARQATQAETALKELDRNYKQQDAIYNSVASRLLRARKGGLTHEQLLEDANELKSAGLIDEEHYINFHNTIKKLPQNALYDYARAVGMRAQGAAKTMETVFPKVERSDIGGAEVFTQQSPTEGEVRQVGVLPKTLTPEKKGELIEGLDVDGSITGVRGAPYKLPYEQVFGARSAQREGGVPSGQSMARVGQEGAGASATSASPRFIITGRPVQEAEALRKMGDEYSKVVELANINKKFGLALDEGEKLLEEYQPGAGANVRERIAKGLSAIGVNKELVDKVANGSLGKSEAFRSIMLDVAVGRLKQAMSGTGQISNLEFATFGENKPNPEMTPQAVRDLIQYYRKIIKFEDAYAKGYFHYLDPRNGKNPLDFQNWWSGVTERWKAEEAKRKGKK